MWCSFPNTHPLNIRFTYEIAPIFILMEHVVLKKMREIIGFPEGDSILAPGIWISLFFLIVSFHRSQFKWLWLRRLSSDHKILSSSDCFLWSQMDFVSFNLLMMLQEVQSQICTPWWLLDTKCSRNTKKKVLNPSLNWSSTLQNM